MSRNQDRQLSCDVADLTGDPVSRTRTSHFVIYFVTGWVAFVYLYFLVTATAAL